MIEATTVRPWTEKAETGCRQKWYLGTRIEKESQLDPHRWWYREAAAGESAEGVLQWRKRE